MTGQRSVGRTLLAGGLFLLAASCKDATAPSVPVPTTLFPSAGTVSFTALGQSQTLTATVLDQNGSPLPTAPIQWASSADAVATVQGGLVTATGNGTATITVASGTASAQILVSVAQVPASMSLSVASATFAALGDTSRVVATVLDAGGSAFVGAPVTWSVLDTLVAVVGGDGLLTAVADGSTQLVAISGAALATAAVTVAQAPSAVMLSADSVAMGALGDTVALAAFVTDAGGSLLAQPLVTWASADTSVVKVSPAGVVTAVANGSALVTATSGTAAGQAQVVVRQIAATLTLLPDSLVLKDPGDTAQLGLTAFDARGAVIAAPSIAWSSADAAVAGVDSTGLVTAVEAGTVLISAEVDGVVGQRSVRVEPEVTLVAAGPTTLSGQVATQLSLSVRVEDLLGAGYGGATVSWSAGSGSITSGATVQSDAAGYASAVWLLGTGSGGQTATASIESRGSVVEVAFGATGLPGPAVSAALVADSILLSGIGETAVLGPTYTDQYGNPTTGSGVVWESRDPGVASVSSEGLVTAMWGPDSTWVVASLGSPVDSLLVTVALRGAITVTFDDGFIDAYTNAWPVFQELGMIGNIAVNPAQVGFPAYMDKAMLDELHAAGFSIVSHTMTHDSLTTATLGELDYELRLSQEWIEAQGYGGGNVFVVPYHDWGTRERDAVAVYYQAARGTSANSTVPDTLVSWKPDDPYDLTGIDADQLPFTTVQGRDRLRQMLQRTVDEGVFLDVFFHWLDAADVDAFRQTLAVIDEFRDRVLPYRQLYPENARSVI
jgi:uncharacterized protein YjdB